MSVSDRVKFTKEGLLDVAGFRTVRAFSTPYEGDFRDVAPVEMSLKDYTTFLDQRDSTDQIRQNFSYVFERLPDDEGPLSFARSPPKLFKDQILLRSAQFTLGGQLMGSALVVKCFEMFARHSARFFHFCHFLVILLFPCSHPCVTYHPQQRIRYTDIGRSDLVFFDIF